MLIRLASNAGANIVSGIVSATYQLSLTALAVRTWSPPQFAAWGLALSMAMIVPLFGSNLSSVITRRLVLARHREGYEREGPIIRAGDLISRVLALLAFVLVFTTGLIIRNRSQVQAGALPEFALLLSMLLFTNVWMVLWQSRFGQYFADEDNWRPTLTLLFARMGGLVGMLCGLHFGSGTPLIASLGLAAGTWLPLLVLQSCTTGPKLRDTQGVSRTDLSIEVVANLRIYAGFAVWAVGALVIQYGLPPLMVLVAPERFNAFYIASTLNLVALGSLSAAMSALLAPLSRLHARGEGDPLRRLAVFGPLFCAGCCLIALSLAWYTLDPVLSAIHSQGSTAVAIRPFLALLGFQTIVRMAAMGYSVTLASVANARQMAGAIVLEIAITFILGVPLGLSYGADALIAALVLAGFASSLYTAWVGVQLHPKRMISNARALGILIASQALICGAWAAITLHSGLTLKTL